MLNTFKTFASDESGAVTVDWVVLTAALVGLGLAVMTVVRGGVQNVSDDIDGTLCGIQIGNSFTTDNGGTVFQNTGGSGGTGGC